MRCFNRLRLRVRSMRVIGGWSIAFCLLFLSRLVILLSEIRQQTIGLAVHAISIVLVTCSSDLLALENLVPNLEIELCTPP